MTPRPFVKIAAVTPHIQAHLRTLRDACSSTQAAFTFGFIIGAFSNDDQRYESFAALDAFLRLIDKPTVSDVQRFLISTGLMRSETRARTKKTPRAEWPTVLLNAGWTMRKVTGPDGTETRWLDAGAADRTQHVPLSQRRSYLDSISYSLDAAWASYRRGLRKP